MRCELSCTCQGVFGAVFWATFYCRIVRMVMTPSSPLLEAASWATLQKNIFRTADYESMTWNTKIMSFMVKCLTRACGCWYFPIHMSFLGVNSKLVSLSAAKGIYLAFIFHCIYLYPCCFRETVRTFDFLPILWYVFLMIVENHCFEENKLIQRQLLKHARWASERSACFCPFLQKPLCRPLLS